MKKTIPLTMLVIAILAVSLAIAKIPAAENGLNSGKSPVSHLYLFEKHPITWEIEENGAWGKMMFNTKNNKFVFNGHMLVENESYSLIYYPDPWPGNGALLLGSGEANEYGDVHIKGTFDFNSIPVEDDENEGAKIWLVLSSDFDEKMIAWNPTEYLFEYALI